MTTKSDRRLDELEERIAAIEKVMVGEVKPVVVQYNKRFGHTFNKFCKSCGAPLPMGKTPVKCPKCEKHTGFGEGRYVIRDR